MMPSMRGSLVVLVAAVLAILGIAQVSEAGQITKCTPGTGDVGACVALSSSPPAACEWIVYGVFFQEYCTPSLAPVLP
jgi:hypothetical protein